MFTELKKNGYENNNPTKKVYRTNRHSYPYFD